MQAGRSCICQHAVVTHYEGKSSEQVVAARHIRFHSSRVRYVRKYHGRLAAAAVRSFLLLTFVFQWAEEAVKWLAGLVLPSQRAKQAMRRERMGSLRPGAALWAAPTRLRKSPQNTE